MASNFHRSSQNDYINNLFRQESFSNEVNITNLGHALTTLQDTSSQLGQSLQRNVKSQLDPFFSVYKGNEQVYKQGQEEIQDALSSSHNILLHDATIIPKTITSNYLTTQSKFENCEQTITGLQQLIKVSQHLDTVYTILTSQQQQQNKMEEAIQQIFLIIKQIDAVEKNESIIAWQGLKQKATQYRQWITSLVHDGLVKCVVFDNKYADSDSNTKFSSNFQNSITILSSIKLNNTTFYLSDLLRATILLDIQHSELASIQRQIIKYFIDPFLSIQRTSGPSIQLSINKKEEDNCQMTSLLYIVEYLPSTSNDDSTNSIKRHHDRCTDAEKLLQHTDLILKFIFNGMFNNTENNDTCSSLKSLQQLFGHLLLPYVLDKLVTKAMVPTASLAHISLSDLPIALNDLDILAKAAINFENQWAVDYAHLSQDITDLPLGRYAKNFDQHVAHQRRSILLNDARKIMLRKVYDAEEHSDLGKITQTPRVLLTMIQQAIQEIQLLSSELDKYPETATTLKRTVQEVLMLYITIMPSFHRHLFLQHSSHAMVFRNDCYWLANNMTALMDQDGNNDALAKLKRLGDTWERIVMAQFMTNVDIILSKAEEWNHAGLPTDLHQQQQHKQLNKEVISLESAIEVIVHQINTFITDINKVVTQKQSKAFLISIADNVFKKIMDGILGMGDIAADTSRSMAQALNGLAQLGTLFSMVVENEESVNEVTLRQWIPHWQPFWMLKDMLDMTMADILDALYRGDLACFTHDQLTHLVCALFSDTPRRDETIRIIKSSDLNEALHRPVSLSTTSTQQSSSKRSISLTNPHNEQPIKRSFLERLLIPEDEVQQSHTMNNEFTSNSSISSNYDDQSKGVDDSDINEWNQDSNWSGDEEESNFIHKITNNKIESASETMTSPPLKQNQKSISNKFIYDESLDVTDDKWGESDSLEIPMDEYGVQDSGDMLFEQDVAAVDDGDDKELLEPIHRPIINSKFGFNEILDGENDGWDQDDILDITDNQLNNNQPRSSLRTESSPQKPFSKQQLSKVSSKFGFNEALSDNLWEESELLDKKISDAEDDIHLSHEVNRAPSSHSQEHIGQQQIISVENETSINNDLGSNNHEVSSSLDLVGNIESDNDSVDIKNEEKLAANLFDNQQQQSTISNIFKFDDNELLEDGWDESEPLDTIIESININKKIKQQETKEENQSTIDNQLQRNEIKLEKDIESDKYNCLNTNKDGEKGDIFKKNEPDKLEEQVMTSDNIDLDGIMDDAVSDRDQLNTNVLENNQYDHAMNLLEQGLYDPNQHLQPFDDEIGLDHVVENEAINLNQSVVPNKNNTIDSCNEDIEQDQLQPAAENSNTCDDNKNTNVDNLQAIGESSIIYNDDNSVGLDKKLVIGSNADDIVNESSVLDQPESITELSITNNDNKITELDKEHLAIKYNIDDVASENNTLSQLELMAENITGDNDDDDKTAKLDQLEIPTETSAHKNTIRDLLEPSAGKIANSSSSDEKSTVLDRLESLIENTVISDENESVKLDQLDTKDINGDNAKNDENDIPNQPELSVKTTIAKDNTNDNELSQIKLTDQNIINDNINNNESSPDLYDNLMGCVLSDSNQSQQNQSKFSSKLETEQLRSDQNDITNAIDQSRVDISQDHCHRQPTVSSKFEFNDDLIDDDGWDQEEPVDIIINDIYMNKNSNRQPHIEDTQIKELQSTSGIDEWDQDEPLSAMIKDTSTDTVFSEQKHNEDNKTNISQNDNADDSNDEYIHSNLQNKIKNEISEGMSTKLEQINSNNLNPQQQPKNQPSITSDRFIFDGLSDDSGWDQDSGWLDDDIDDFIITSIDNTASSSPQPSKQENQTSTEQDRQHDVTTKSHIEKNRDGTEKSMAKNNIPTFNTTFAFNDDEPSGWSDAEEDIF
ncbi:hypothetical protein BJ944DRAFT_63568 [Cunninghamella echinulata]|nr:hypothetical protein BJ944DRAFT_63568 [Cunninghamella echinulata]